MTAFNKLLATAAVIAVLAAAPARAEDVNEGSAFDSIQTSFSQAVKTIQGWFDAEDVGQIEPAAGDDAVTAGMGGDDALQVPPPVGPEAIEPAAGGMMDDDILQVPPPYVAPTSVDPDARPRASAFDDMPAMAAFGEGQSAGDMAGIMPASGEDTPVNMEGVACDSVLEAAANADMPESEKPEAAVIEACQNKASVSEAAQPAAEPVETDPAQPAFGEPAGMAEPLPETRPAAGADEAAPEAVEETAE